MSHLSVKIGDHFLALKSDASIDIEDTNPYFNDGIESWSYPFDIPIDGNREILSNIEDVQSDHRLVSLENTPMSIYVDGIAFRNGKVATTEDQQLQDSVSLNMTSTNKSLSDLYGDLTCQDIPLPEEDHLDLKIGEKIGGIIVSGTSNYHVRITGKAKFCDAGVPINPAAPNNQLFDDDDVIYLGRGEAVADGTKPFRMEFESTQKSVAGRSIDIQALGFSTNKQYRSELIAPFTPQKDSDGNLIIEQDYINTSTEFGGTINQPDGSTRRALYFNSRVSYIHHKVDSNGDSSDEILNDKNGYGPYYVLEADRQQSGICFYILYFLEALFKYFEIVYDQSNLLAVNDLKRLAFFTTSCKYNVQRKYPFASFDYDFPKMSNFDDNGTNQWLSDRNTNGYLKVDSETVSSDEASKKSCTVNFYSRAKEVTIQGSHNTTSTTYKIDESSYSIQNISIGSKLIRYYGDHKVEFTVETIEGVQESDNYKCSACVHEMFANSDNFPEMSVSSLMESLWASFGIRFFLDQQNNLVTPVFIRDIFRSHELPISLNGDLYTIYKNSEKITGFRMRYSNESDKKEQNSYIRKGVTDYDTNYDYQVEKSKNIQPITDYFSLAHPDTGLSTGDTTCYVDTTTGNAYRIKINKDALDSGDIDSLQPALFEVAKFHGVEIGDCSDDNEDFIQEVTSEFAPLDLNDINYTAWIHAAKMCPFVDEDMWNEQTKTERIIKNVVDSNLATTFLVNEYLETPESYDPSSTDDGNSPLQSTDWGNSIVMMRGGGSDAHIEYYDYNYDGFGNSKYRMISGDYAIDTDSISVFGHQYDYNGNLPGIGGGTTGSYVGTYTKDEAKSILTEIFPDSNADLTASSRKIHSSIAANKGWDVDPNDYSTHIASSSEWTDFSAGSGVNYEFLYTPVLDDGSVLSPSEVSQYMEHLQQLSYESKRSIMDIDKEEKHFIVAKYSGENKYDAAEYFAELLHQLADIYYGNATQVTVETPSNVWVDHGSNQQDRISLKIRAYHTDKDGNILCDQNVARRGLYDQFMSEYAHFLLHRKKVTITARLNAVDLQHIEWHRRYTIFGYTGWLNKVTTHITALEGIESVTIEMFIL